MIILVGKSGSGKSSVMNHIISQGFKQIVKYTTRKPRSNEVNNSDYIFITNKEFDILLKEKKICLVESFAMVDDNVRYGYSVASLKEINETKNLVTIMTPNTIRELYKIDWINTDTIYQYYLNCYHYIRIQRLLDRGDNIQEINRRLNADDVDFAKHFIMPKTRYLNAEERTPEMLARHIIDNYFKSVEGVEYGS